MVAFFCAYSEKNLVKFIRIFLIFGRRETLIYELREIVVLCRVGSTPLEIRER